MIKVLFIDDAVERHLMVESVALEEDIELVQAYNVDEGLDLVEDDYDLVCIDHDLGEDKRNGTTIAKKIKSLNKEIPFVWVHSANPVGSLNIYSILSRCKNIGGFVKEPFNFIALTQVFSYIKEFNKDDEKD
jgi:CheY-like chemotaxis protein